MTRITKVFFMGLELLLRIVVIPQLRAKLLHLLGASIGKNVRIYEVHFFNLDNGFKHFIVEDDVHIGTGCYFDLEGKITIKQGATLSPKTTILTHSDPGCHHNSILCDIYPPIKADVYIGQYCWIGTNTTILAGSFIHAKSIIGAASLVKGELMPKSLYCGIPVKKIKELEL